MGWAALTQSGASLCLCIGGGFVSGRMVCLLSPSPWQGRWVTPVGAPEQWGPSATAAVKQKWSGALKEALS
jgi:hypothetical protein